MDHTTLVRRYRGLLRAYPQRYRAERADEIVGTLLESARPGQRWPSPREAGSLVLGGLRAHTGANALAGRRVWHDALHIAAVLAAVLLAWQVMYADGSRIGGWAGVVWAVVVTGLAVAVFTGRYRVALVFLALDAAIAVLVVTPFPYVIDLAWVIQERLVLVGALGVLAWRRRRDRPPVKLALVGLALVMPFRTLGWWMLGDRLSLVAIVLLVGVVPVLLMLIAAVVDGRLAAAYGLMLLGSAVPVAALAANALRGPGDVLYMSVVLMLAIGFVVVGWLSMRRQARV